MTKSDVYLVCSLYALHIFHVICTITTTLTIDMPPKDTLEDESYLCRAVFLKKVIRSHIVSLNIDVDRDRVHHVATSVCEAPISQEEIWECRNTQGSNCLGASAGFGGWDVYTNDNTTFQFPEDVSLEVGSRTKMRYFILQLHYKHKQINQTKPAVTVSINLADKPTSYQYQIYTLANRGFIPSNTATGYQSNVACQWKQPAVKAFRYTVHTHHIGYHVECFLIRNRTWILIGSALPQMKTKSLYNIPGGPQVIQTGDILAARCLYINQGKEPVSFGMADGNEMCEIRIEFGYRREDQTNFRKQLYCESESPTFQFKNFPGVLDYF